MMAGSIGEAASPGFGTIVLPGTVIEVRDNHALSFQPAVRDQETVSFGPMMDSRFGRLKLVTFRD